MKKHENYKNYVFPILKKGFHKIPPKYVFTSGFKVLFFFFWPSKVFHTREYPGLDDMGLRAFCPDTAAYIAPIANAPHVKWLTYAKWWRRGQHNGKSENFFAGVPFFGPFLAWPFLLGSLFLALLCSP